MYDVLALGTWYNPKALLGTYLAYIVLRPSLQLPYSTKLFSLLTSSTPESWFDVRCDVIDVFRCHKVLPLDRGAKLHRDGP